MILNYSKIIGSKIVTFEDGIILGEVADVVIEPDTMEIGAIILKNQINIFTKTRLILNVDIIGIDKDVVAIKDEESITKLNDTPKIKEWIKLGFSGLKQKIITRSKATVGYVYDYTVNCDTFVINSLLTNNLFVEKVIPINSVVEYKKKLIIVKDEFEHIKISSAISEIGS